MWTFLCIIIYITTNAFWKECNYANMCAILLFLRPAVAMHLVYWNCFTKSACVCVPMYLSLFVCMCRPTWANSQVVNTACIHNTKAKHFFDKLSKVGCFFSELKFFRCGDSPHTDFKSGFHSKLFLHSTTIKHWSSPVRKCVSHCLESA